MCYIVSGVGLIDTKLTLEADTFLSADSFTVAWLEGARMERAWQMVSFSELDNAVTSVLRLESAAPTGSLCLCKRCNMENVLFHRVSTSWISFSCGLPTCPWLCNCF